MPTAILLAGPNGAGKTTFGSARFRDESNPPEFLNADEIARGLRHAGAQGAALDMAAGRLLLQRLDAAVEARRNFVVETTLSTRLYVRRIHEWRRAGYRIILAYVRLPDAARSLARVRKRASQGGHDIAEADVLRRFGRSLALLEEAYKPIVDDWWIVDSREGEFTLSDWSGRS